MQKLATTQNSHWLSQAPRIPPRDGRYALHSETCPPPRQDDGFAVTGRVREVTDPAVRRVVHDQVLAERNRTVWPGFDDDVVLELAVGRCLLRLTQAGDGLPQGPTVWKAGAAAGL